VPVTFQGVTTRIERKGCDLVHDGTMGDRRPVRRRRPRHPRPPRRVGPNVPDIAPRPHDRRGFATARPEFFVRFFSGGNSRLGRPGVHYTQLDARVAPRYVRQTALLLIPPPFRLPHCTTPSRFPSCFFPCRFHARVLVSSHMVLIGPSFRSREHEKPCSYFYSIIELNIV